MKALAAMATAGAAVLLAGCSLIPISTPNPSGAATTSDLSIGLTQYPQGQRPAVGPIAGDTIDGGTLDLASLRGRVVVVNAWGHWCEPCREELPFLAAAANAADAEQVAFVGLDVNDDPVAAQKMATELGVPYPSIIDRTAALLTQIPGVPPKNIPSTVVLDRSGAVAARVIGPVHRGELEPIIAALIAER